MGLGELQISVTFLLLPRFQAVCEFYLAALETTLFDIYIYVFEFSSVLCLLSVCRTEPEMALHNYQDKPDLQTGLPLLDDFSAARQSLMAHLIQNSTLPSTAQPLLPSDYNEL